MNIKALKLLVESPKQFWKFDINDMKDETLEITRDQVQQAAVEKRNKPPEKKRSILFKIIYWIRMPIAVIIFGAVALFWGFIMGIKGFFLGYWHGINTIYSIAKFGANADTEHVKKRVKEFKDSLHGR